MNSKFELRPNREMPPPCFRGAGDIRMAILAVIAKAGRRVVRLRFGKRNKAYLQRTAHTYASRLNAKISTSTDSRYLWIKFERLLEISEISRSKQERGWNSKLGCSSLDRRGLADRGSADKGSNAA